MSGSLVTIRNLEKTYPNGTRALRGVDLDIVEGQTTALVGESGCGKSTLAKILMGLESPTAGEVLIRGRLLSSYTSLERAHLIQLIFQDPASSLNPRHTVGQILREPMIIRGNLKKSEIETKIKNILSAVGFDESILPKYPHMFSGGQKQRIVLARALALQPAILICDEPVSALDVSVQAQILNLIVDLQKKFNLTYLFISHDLHVVKWVSHTVYVMYLGKIVERAAKADLFRKPQHPYSELLLKSTPQLGQKPPDFSQADEIDPSLQTACQFLNRCSYKTEPCRTKAPQLAEQKSHSSRCWNPLDL